jgi:hypothetical protein
MTAYFACQSCGGFVPQTELLKPRCNNAGGCPLSEPKIFKIAHKGCPIWSPQPCAE